VHRDGPLPGAILTRVAASHIRVGTFQFFSARRDVEALTALTAHALARHYPEVAGTGNDALALLERVIDAHAELVARWLGVGFVHGVMNTDNTAISGETLDYGPCAFLDEYDPARTFSSIDHGGRYAFGNQPHMALWNMGRLGEALLPLIATDLKEAARIATERLERFVSCFEAAHLRVLRAKFGLTKERERDGELLEAWLAALAAHPVDYTLFFRRLCAVAEGPAHDDALLALFEGAPPVVPAFLEVWRSRLAEEDASPDARAASMRRANPAFIPRNHRIEEAIEAAVERGDFRPFETLVDVLARPWDDQPGHEALAAPPGPEQREYRTFCGT
jgi:uncharacterized protein YdiU (UPF0061 family)